MTYPEQILDWAEWVRDHAPSVGETEYTTLLEAGGDNATLYNLAMNYWVVVSRVVMVGGIRGWVEPPPSPNCVTPAGMKVWLKELAARVAAVPDPDPRDWHKFCLLVWDILGSLNHEGAVVSSPLMEHVSDLCLLAEMILDEPVEMPHE